MRTIEEIRRRNMETLIEEHGGIQKLADVLESSHSQTSQWLHGFKDSKTGRPRGLSSDSARRIERLTNKPHGWLDVEHGRPYASKSKEAELAARIIDEMPDDQEKERALKVITTLAQSAQDYKTPQSDKVSK